MKKYILWFSLLGIGALALLFWGCNTYRMSGRDVSLGPVETGAALPAPPAAPAPAAPPRSAEFTVVPVLYATDRKPDRSLEEWRQNIREKGSDYTYFGREMEFDLAAGIPIGTPLLKYGLATVSIPRVHKPGRMERPDWEKLEFRERLERHFTLRGLLPLSATEMTQRIHAMAEVSPEKDTFVFIHGYNVKFNDAVMRTAQIAQDFGFVGAPILYSWSSSGSLDGYGYDGDMIDLTAPALKRFLDEVVLKAGSKKIHLVAHSMGNRALTLVLESFAHENRGPLFDEVILAAPDVLRTAFLSRLQSVVGRTARRVTLYASSDDLALRVSERYHSLPRAGQSGPGLVLLQGIDTIDASGVDTDMLAHGYFYNAQAVIADIRELLVNGTPAGTGARRLLRIDAPPPTHWRIGTGTAP